jgi:hypothetical protein
VRPVARWSRWLWLAILTLIATSGFASQPRRPTDRPTRTLVPAHVEEWLTSGGGRPSIPVLINGRGPYRMGVDWGANALLLSETTARDLGLAVVTDSTTSPGRQLRIAAVDSIAIGEARFAGLVCTLGGFRDTAIAGVLGFNVFADALLTLDLPRRSLMLDPGDLPAPDDHTVFALSEPDPDRIRGLFGPSVAPAVRAFFGTAADDSGPVAQPSVRVTLGDRAFSCVMDTRAPGWLTLPDSLFSGFTVISGPHEARAYGPTMGAMRLRIARVSEPLKLGDAVVAQPVVQFRDRPGPLIGMDLMTQFAITLDQRNGRVRFVRASRDTLEPPAQAWESAEEDTAQGR